MCDFDRIEQLFQQMLALTAKPQQELTIFGIGSRGYYENPTTDILAFFLDDSAAHGLDALVLTALMDILPEPFNKLDCSLSISPEREVKTKRGKRIDLLLESEEWVMLIENKVFHTKVNPFSDYQNHLLKDNINRYRGKEAIFVLLSPDGLVPAKQQDRWIGVSYSQFIESIKKALANCFLSQPMNKWVILLREFILHLESVMSTPNVSKEALDFVLDNLTQIKKIQDLKTKTIKQYQQSLHQQLEAMLDTTLHSALVHWYGYPAIRFAYTDWPTDSDVVLFLDGRESKSFCINYYSSEINEDASRKVADEHFMEQDCRQPWNEVRDTCRCYKAHFDNDGIEHMQDKLAHKLRLMNDFEHNIRPTVEKN